MVVGPRHHLVHETIVVVGLTAWSGHERFRLSRRLSMVDGQRANPVRLDRQPGRLPAHQPDRLSGRRRLGSPCSRSWIAPGDLTLHTGRTAPIVRAPEAEKHRRTCNFSSYRVEVSGQRSNRDALLALAQNPGRMRLRGGPSLPEITHLAVMSESPERSRGRQSTEHRPGAPGCP
jgi:hypothetical protein